MRKVVISTNIISTIAGDGAASYGGDNGQATSATLCNPVSVAISSSGKLQYDDSSTSSTTYLLSLTRQYVHQ